MRIVGLDIHRVFAEAVMLDEGKVIRLGRVGTRTLWPVRKRSG